MHDGSSSSCSSSSPTARAGWLPRLPQKAPPRRMTSRSTVRTRSGRSSTCATHATRRPPTWMRSGSSWATWKSMPHGSAISSPKWIGPPPNWSARPPAKNPTAEKLRQQLADVNAQALSIQGRFD